MNGLKDPLIKVSIYILIVKYYYGTYHMIFWIDYI